MKKTVRAVLDNLLIGSKRKARWENMFKFKRAVYLKLVFMFMMTLVFAASAPAFAESVPGSFIFDISEGNITVAAGSSSNINVTYGAAQTTTADFTNTQEITIIGSSTEHMVVVAISGNTANIILDDADIEFTTDDVCAFSIDSGTVNLMLSGDNILKSSGGNPGLRVPPGTTLTIDGVGSLSSTGAANAAGIGGGNGVANGTIIINKGIITASGGCTGIGTGNASFATGGDITINDGTVTATGGNSGAGIGSGGGFCSIGKITITDGTVTATGGSWGAGIGTGGSFGGSGEIYISGGTVMATGGSISAGIGPGGAIPSSAPTVTIAATAMVMAASDGTVPAITAAGDDLAVESTAYVLMANFTSEKSSDIASDVYLKLDSSLKASFAPETPYTSIAFTLPSAATYTLYTDDVRQQHSSGADFTLSSAGMTVFTDVKDYLYTVTLNKDDEPWTEDAPDLELSIARDSLTEAITGTCPDGEYSFTGFNPSLTYYVWDTTNDQYTGQILSASSPSATIDYYSVTLTAGTGIESTTGGGAYLSGSDVIINATVTDGYSWYKWMDTNDGSLVSTDQSFTIDNISEARSYTAKAYLTRAEGVAWIDAGHYDSDLYEELTSPDFAGATVEISTPQQLAALARAVDIVGKGFDGVTFTLTQDIDLSGYLWDPIGIEEDDVLYGAADGDAHPFSGNFDGNGHVISNMNIQGSYVSAGLFGNVNSSNLDDLDSDSTLVTISNVVVDGAINVTGTERVGGVVGVGGFLILTNCANQATITATCDNVFGGGVLGFGLYVLMDGCVNQTGADISITATSTDAEDITAVAGGITGVVFLGSIYNSANFASVTGSVAEGQPMAGGILGLGLVGTVDNCYNTGAVTAEGSNSLAGGICGSDMDILETGDPYIRNCYNAGAVTATTATGVAASVNPIENCYYLAGTAEYAYYDPENSPVVGSSISATEMQADDFCQTLNDWVTTNPVSSSLTESMMELDGVAFIGWVQRDGVNNGYPIFANDPRYVEPSDNPSGGGFGIVYYKITVETNEGGSVSPSTSKIKANASQTYTITPDAGYHISDVLVDGTSIGAVSSYEFARVRTSHTLEVVFAKDSQATNLYSDVAGSDWFYDAIQFVSEQGLMNGMGENRFEPNIGTSRAMIVSILWRLEGKPGAGPGKSGVFGDVGEGQWYTDGIEWAAANGVVLGYDAAHFGPDDCISREQLAAILYRYASDKGYDVSARDSLESFSDASEISDWALEAVKWAVAEGFLSGVNDMELDPKGSATRAQAAAILMRFIEKVQG